ncbi:DUF6463 family protein [Agromyces sp. NPDC049794]|uniref:DUF6463 family protein n=1 Tax=unclassified Agromyces TaxID=2639701 RepID=UPI0033C5F520
MKSTALTAAGGWVAIVGPVIHVTLTSIPRADVWGRIVSAGWWNTATLRPSTEQLEVAESFWISAGSFAVPLFVLGVLAVLSAREGRPMPRFVGWILILWGMFSASLMPISGAWVFIVVGVLFLVDTWAARRGRRDAIE